MSENFKSVTEFIDAVAAGIVCENDAYSKVYRDDSDKDYGPWVLKLACGTKLRSSDIWYAYYRFHPVPPVPPKKMRPMTNREIIAYQAYHPHEIMRARETEDDKWIEGVPATTPWKYKQHATIDESGNLTSEWMEYTTEE